MAPIEAVDSLNAAGYDGVVLVAYSLEEVKSYGDIVSAVSAQLSLGEYQIYL